MGKIIARNVVERRSGYLYYVDGSGNVCEAKMARGGRKKKATTRRRTTTARRTTARRTTTARRRR